MPELEEFEAAIDKLDDVTPGGSREDDKNPTPDNDEAAKAAEAKAAEDKKAADEAAKAQADADAKAKEEEEQRKREEEGTDDDDKDGKKPPQYRFRPSDPVEALAFDIRKNSQKAGNPIPLKDALAQAEQILKKEDKPADEPSDLDKWKAELTEVQKALDKSSQDKELFTPEVRKNQRRETELERMIEAEEKRRSADEADQQAKSKAEFETAFNASLKEAEELYPDSKNPDSELSKAITAEIDTILSNKKHPLHGESDLPMILTAKHAARMRIAPQAKAADDKQPDDKKRYTPVSGHARTNPPPDNANAAKEAERMEKMKGASFDDAIDMLDDEEPVGVGGLMFGKAPA